MFKLLVILFISLISLLKKKSHATADHSYRNDFRTQVFDVTTKVVT